MHSRKFLDWFWACFNIFFIWSFGSICSGFSSQVLGINPVVYVSTIFLSCSIILLLYAGPGLHATSVLRSFQAWGYGFSLILSFIASFGLFSQVTPAEGELLQMFTAILSVIVGWVFFNRVPNVLQVLGMGMILIGIYLVCNNLPIEKLALVVLLIIVLGIFQSCRSFIGEYFHYVFSTDKNTVKDNMRLIGFTFFSIGFFLLLIFLPISYLQTITNTTIHPIIPDLKDFQYFKGIVTGILVGILVIVPARFLEFNSLAKLKTENYLALGAIGPFATMFWQRITQPFTGLNLTEFTSDDIIAACFITAGGLTMVISKTIFKARDKDILNEYMDYISQNTNHIEDTHSIALNTLKFYDSNKSEASDILNIPILVLEEMIKGEKSVKNKYLKQITRIYRKEIVTKDTLTKLNNRMALQEVFAKIDRQDKDYTIIYMDLNKFKSINDTFGHEYGDETLQVISNRIKDFEDGKTKAFRLGGDEFLIVTKVTKEKSINKLTNSLKTEICRPFVLSKIDMVVNVGVSIGVAISRHYPDLKPKELLTIADESMYKEKVR